MRKLLGSLWWLRILIVSVVCMPFVLHSYGADRYQLLDRLEQIIYDVRLRYTMPETVDKRVVIIDVDERSLKAQGQWPWSREKLAKLVNSLFNDFGVRAMGFDITFPEPENRGGDAVLDVLYAGPLGQHAEIRGLLDEAKEASNTDKKLAAAIEGQEVTLGYAFVPRVAAGQPATVGKLPEPIYSAKALAESGLDLPFARAAGYTSNVEVLTDASAAAGFFDNPLIDNDGVFRRVPLLEYYDGDVYESLALAIMRRANNLPPPVFEFAVGTEGRSGREIEGITLGEQFIPTDENVAVLVPYRGRAGQFPYISATHILDGSADLELLFDAIVLLGTSAPGLFDLRVTPVGATFPGVEVHANIVSGLLDGNFLHRPSYAGGIETVMLVCIALLLLILLPRLGAAGDVLLLASIVAAVVWLNLWFWTEQQLVVALVNPVLFALICFATLNTLEYFYETRSKRKLSRFFGQYIPPELVDEMNERGEEISLQGDARELSVLFSDVRGFTGISEGLDAQSLTELMNAFLTPITKAIHESRGTIDKYMGDAVMAFWGAPLTDEDHAVHAIEAGFLMLQRLEELQPVFAERGWPAIKVGIGINSGTMNVGNMGSEFRVAYTVMGDAVNLGSRIEGLTKEYGVQFMVSEFTVALAPQFLYRELDLARVKGKQEPVRFYEPVGLASQQSAETLQRLETFHTALAAFRAQHWDEAEGLLEKLLISEPERAVYSVYLQRIAAYREIAPPDPWDGVFTHTSK